MKVRVFLHDEIPALGCGWRWLEVRKSDTHVKLRDAMGREARCKLEVWNELKAGSVAMLDRMAA
jgi:hypothetical protein